MIVLRSALFNALFYGWTLLACLTCFWCLALPKRHAMKAAYLWLAGIQGLERHVLGLTFEVRGREHLPDGPCIVAAKHQSAWETMKLHVILHDPAIVLKRELLYIPIWGQFLRRAGLIPIDRSAGGKAMADMMGAAGNAIRENRPIVIFPQGTRISPGRQARYRTGVGRLYTALDLPLVPMALNSGVYWPRRRFLKRPGRIIVEFLPPIPPGLSFEEVMIELETRLETATNALVVEAGGNAAPVNPERRRNSASANA